MPEVLMPRSPSDPGWIEFREMLARAARQTHFDAFEAGATNRPALLKLSRNLAELALSIPVTAAADPQDPPQSFPPDYRPPSELKG